MRIAFLILFLALGVSAQTDEQQIIKLSNDLAAAKKANDSLQKQIDAFGAEREAWLKTLKAVEDAKLTPCAIAVEATFKRLDTYYTEMLSAPDKNARKQLRKKSKLARWAGARAIKSSCPVKGFIQEKLGL